MSRTRNTAIPPDLYCDAAGAEHKERCRRLIVERGYRRVLEVGGGRSTLFSPQEAAALGVDYTVLDVSAEELTRVPGGFRTVHADICDPAVVERAGTFDFALSIMVAEHVRDGEAMHANLFALLRPGGAAFHWFPTLFCPVFVANRLMPERAAAWLLRRTVRQERPKFPARYSRCRGPTAGMRRMLLGQGWVIEEYRPFYGTHYTDRLPVLGRLDRALAAWAARRRNPHLTSYAYLVLGRPG